MMSEDSDGIETEVDNAAYSPVLRRPNHYQNRIQFYTYWMLSKLCRGNAYALKERDNRGVVTVAQLSAESALPAPQVMQGLAVLELHQLVSRRDGAWQRRRTSDR